MSTKMERNPVVVFSSPSRPPPPLASQAGRSTHEALGRTSFLYSLLDQDVGNVSEVDMALSGDSVA